MSALRLVSPTRAPQSLTLGAHVWQVSSDGSDATTARGNGSRRDSVAGIGCLGLERAGVEQVGEAIDCALDPSERRTHGLHSHRESHGRQIYSVAFHQVDASLASTSATVGVNRVTIYRLEDDSADAGQELGKRQQELIARQLRRREEVEAATACGISVRAHMARALSHLLWLGEPGNVHRGLSMGGGEAGGCDGDAAAEAGTADGTSEVSLSTVRGCTQSASVFMFHL